MASYGWSTIITGRTFDETITDVVDALGAEGFGVLTEIDVRETMKNKLGIEFRRYRILGACNPHLAHAALVADPMVGLLMPCNVVVQETEDGDVEVDAVDPRAMFSLMERADDPAFETLAGEAVERLRRVLDTVAGRASVG